MSAFVESYPRPNPDTPLLIFKIGVLGCAPLDFPERLAETYDAELLSTDAIRRVMIDERDAAGMPHLQAQKVSPKGRLMYQARRKLNDGQDVVLDAFFNTVNSRSRVQALAHEAGALSLALWINTTPHTCFQRVHDWSVRNAFAVPTSRWEVAPLRAAKDMFRHVEKPSHEGLDYVFNLNGEDNTNGLLHQFERKVDYYNLAQRYELAEEA